MADTQDFKQVVNDAILDADSLERFINGSDSETVLTRLSAKYPTLQKALKELFTNNGIADRFKTVEQLQTKGADLPDGSYALVADDVDIKNGIYIKEGGSWVKSKYDITSNILNDDDSDILSLRDKSGQKVLSVRSQDGGLLLAGMTEAVQKEILELKKTTSFFDNTPDLWTVKDYSGSSIATIDNKGGLNLTDLSGTVQENIKTLNTESFKKNSVNAKITGKITVDSVVYADLPQNAKADYYEWFLDGKSHSIGSKSYLEITENIVGKAITAIAYNLKAGDATNYDKDGVIGGVEIGADGKSGTLYDGFVLSDGDDFNELDIIAPHKPLGRWFTTRTYLAGARGSDTLLGTMYDTDPYHTGYYDSNRGFPVGYDNMYVNNGYIRLQARSATDFERSHSQGDRNELASMISSVGAFSFYAGDEDTGSTILEFKVRYSRAERNPYGWHPSLWTQSSLPSVTYNSNEWDILEGSHEASQTNYNEWGSNGGRTDSIGYGNTVRIMDDEWHLVTAIFSHSTVKVYIDGVHNRTINKDANSFNEPAYALVSNHILNGGYGGSVYSKEMWDKFSHGTYIDVDYIRLWRKKGTQHIKPLVQIPPVDVDYGSTATITLPPKTELWGDDSVLEHVQIVMTEENEPGGDHTKAYNSLPSFARYDDSTRTLTVNTANQKSGRLNIVIYGYKQDGSSCSPARTYINVAPQITVDTIEIARGFSYDLYAVCDCGVLVTDGVKRTKKIEVLDLPVGVVYNDETGFISASSGASAGSKQVTVQCVNSVNQVSVKQLNLVVK